jgi:hypothetical protein
LAISLAFIAGIVFHRSPLNGAAGLTGWHWPWRDLGLFHTALFLLAPFACVVSVLWMEEKKRGFGVPAKLGILALGNFLMQVMGALAEPGGLRLVRQIVLSPSATSYFMDAMRIRGMGAWLRHFAVVPLGPHSLTHPPGPILFYYAFLHLFGVNMGALIGGCAVGCVASLGVFVTYEFAGLWTEDRQARMTACAFYALLPAITVFFPEMDEVYPILSMLLILFWCKSVDSTERFPREVIYFGLVLFVSLFFAYNLLSVGAFLAYYGLYWIWRQGRTRSSLFKLLLHSEIAAGVCIGLYFVLWLATGYDPVRSFRSALVSQELFGVMFHRTYWPYVLADPYDFVLGAGVLALPLLLFQLFRFPRDFQPMRKEVALTFIAVATILTIDLCGVLRGEAARLWLFLQPLILVPAALEVSRFPWRWRLAILAAEWAVVACLKANMSFVIP